MDLLKVKIGVNEIEIIDDWEYSNVICELEIDNTKLYKRAGTVVYKDDGNIDYLTIGVFDETAFNLDSEDSANEEVKQGQCLNFHVECVEKKI